MRNLLVIIAAILLLGVAGCQTGGNGELIGVQGREGFYQPTPYGMLFIPPGSYQMGNNDQDVPYAVTSMTKTVTLQAFYMDETEITNNEYRQFVFWVRDSLARELLGGLTPEDWWIEEDAYGEPLDPHKLNWETRLDWTRLEQEEWQALDPLMMPEHERYFRRKEIDTRKLNYIYFWVDYKAAARKDFSQEAIATQDEADHDLASLANRPQGVKDRSVFLKKDVINVYPDTLCWIHDFTYSFNEPMAQSYFVHPAYDNYPLVGVSWKQARAFCIWRSEQYNDYRENVMGQVRVNDFRLPTESEWEWAARGGLDLSVYPWGSPYIRNSNGCFLGNYKPLRGNYIDDGGIHTLIVGHYAPNDFGLYDMAGNVAEWCADAYDESGSNFGHDLNMNYSYEPKKTDPEVLKRKVIRGGSWKDIGYYMQNGTRTYEYQDTAKCYIGFRCVETYLGRHIDDGGSSSNVYK